MTVSLTLIRKLQAPVERVFEAFTQADQLASWFAPGNFRVGAVSSDARPGGRYRIEMIGDETSHTVSGEYREVSAPERLVYSWQWEGSDDVSQVTIAFRALTPAETEITLTHEQLPSADSRTSHERGWTGCLVRLLSFIEPDEE